RRPPRIEPDLLLGLAERGGFGMPVAGIDAPTGETDLPGMVGQMRGAARQQDGDAIPMLDKSDENRGGAQRQARHEIGIEIVIAARMRWNRRADIPLLRRWGPQRCRVRQQFDAGAAGRLDTEPGSGFRRRRCRRTATPRHERIEPRADLGRRQREAASVPRMKNWPPLHMPKLSLSLSVSS